MRWQNREGDAPYVLTLSVLFRWAAPPGHPPSELFMCLHGLVEARHPFLMVFLTPAQEFVSRPW